MVEWYTISWKDVFFGMKPCGMKLFGHFQQLKQRKVMGDLFIGGSLKTKVPR